MALLTAFGETCACVTTIRSTLRRTRSAASSGRHFELSVPESVLDGDILSLNPSKLAQLLPERVHKDRAAGSSACIQVTYPENFCCLLRRGGQAEAQRAWRKA